MAVTRDSGLPGDRGRRDSLHHHDRVRKQIERELNKRIGEEDIVAAGPGKKIRVPIKGNKQYRFIFDRGLNEGVGQGDVDLGDSFGPGEGAAKGNQAGTEPGEEMYEVVLDMAEVEEMLFASLGLPRLKPKRTVEVTSADIKFDDIGRKGALLDKKQTLRENLLRNAKQGQARVGGIDKDDLRYVTYRDAPRPKTQAVVFCMMDLSGSMGELQKRISRLFYYWVVSFLRHEYTHVDVVFIGHTTEAFELGEHDFFSRRESGGTLVSSAYRLAMQIQKTRYPSADWNVYTLHTSDGDNLSTDNAATISLIEEFLGFASLVGYLEIPWGSSSYPMISSGRLGSTLIAAKVEGLVCCEARSERDIWPALKQMFAKEQVVSAVEGSGW